MIKIIYIVNILNYLVLPIGTFIIYILKKDFGDLLYCFGWTSIFAGLISLTFGFSKDPKIRNTGLIWFVINFVNIFALIPFIIFLLFFVI